VIGTRWNALPEIIIDEETGLLVEPRDPLSLRNAFARMMESPKLYQRVVLGALEFGKKFSSEVRADEFVNLCRSLAAHK
jgi:glycosyltransferase involved in cell wall biosynthesis